MNRADMDPTAIDWAPFVVDGRRPRKPRALEHPQGLGDRMRTAAFAEFQAIVAFGWAAERFEDAPEALRESWRETVVDEQRHYDAIVARMAELEFSLTDRPVWDGLWTSLQRCEQAREFCVYICNAEERGRQAGLKMIEEIKESDPTTAAIFQVIVDEEVEHIDQSRVHYGVDSTEG